MNPLAVLITDEDRDILQVMRLILEDEGHHVVTATAAGAALRLLQKETFDVVITDVLFAGAEGIDVIRAANRLKPPPGVIAMSVGGLHLQPSYCLDLALAFGAAAPLVKPFSREELLAAIGQATTRTTPAVRRPSPPSHGTKKTLA